MIVPEPITISSEPAITEANKTGQGNAETTTTVLNENGKGDGETTPNVEDWSRDVESVDLSKVDWKNPTTEESIAGHESHIENNVLSTYSSGP